MSAILCEDKHDLPKRVIRPLRDGEALPFYSTDELWRGVCHIVPTHTEQSQPAIAIRLRGATLRRWDKNKAEMLADIERLSLTQMSKKYKFNHGTIRRLLAEAK